MHSHGIYVDIITDKSPQGVADEFIKELKKKKLPGFSTWTYNELEANLRLLTSEPVVDVPISEEEYADFVDNGVVTSERIDSN